MGSRERKRSERRKRKRRSAERDTTRVEVAAAPTVETEANGSGESRAESRSERRNREAREALDPLHEDERPLVVTIAAVLSAVIVVSMLIGFALQVDIPSKGRPPKVGEVLPTAILMGVMAWGMWRSRYWAVLGFQTLLLFLLVGAAVGLVIRASTAIQFLATGGLLVVAGTFFYFMIKALARIQMPERRPRG